MKKPGLPYLSHPILFKYQKSIFISKSKNMLKEIRLKTIL
jgi:hypothetical protein